MRKTKIICTIGPASENEETLTQMCLAGMNVARLNFSHGTYPEHEKKIELIKRVRQKLGLPIAIMLDTKGPEYRIRTFAAGKVTVAEGDDFTFTTREVEGDEHLVGVNYKNLNMDLKPGDTVTVNNGMVKFRVERIEDTEIHCVCLVGGVLSNRKTFIVDQHDRRCRADFGFDAFNYLFFLFQNGFRCQFSRPPFSIRCPEG